LGRNLDQSLTENYVQRCFIRWGEIGSVLVAKGDPVFAAKMLLYKTLPTYRFRNHVRACLRPPWNREKHPGPPAPVASGAEPRPFGLLNLLGERIRRARGSAVSDRYFDRLLRLCARHEIRLDL
jgi:hypothetical protein